MRTTAEGGAHAMAHDGRGQTAECVVMETKEESVSRKMEGMNNENILEPSSQQPGSQKAPAPPCGLCTRSSKIHCSKGFDGQRPQCCPSGGH